jgi:hypothetical protein
VGIAIAMFPEAHIVPKEPGFGLLVTHGQAKGTIMELKTIALASAVALSSTLAFAQAGGGTTMPDNSGSINGGTVGNGSMNNGTNNMGATGTTGNPLGGATAGNPLGGATATNPLGGAAGAGTTGRARAR